MCFDPAAVIIVVAIDCVANVGSNSIENGYDMSEAWHNQLGGATTPRKQQ